ncbi:MAG: L-lactate dehydrogenase [Candidatus Lokiarchaeota archaeon]|nr:L-lactate dehydrogenase [Candidatus Lokiarchaeota archaeon]MBD3339997.1 L-lactate dehydrogenase [Candidatus Lokiarchaeota archaeon]
MELKLNDLKPKISIIGCGNVGVRFAYALTIKGIAREIVMVDIDKKRLRGEVMDLSHGAPYTDPVKIIAGDYEDIENSDLVVVTAGKNQEPGESRLDLVKKNINLFRQIIPKIIDIDKDPLLLIVSNPVDILSYASWKLSGKPAHHVIGSGTSLDTARFRYLLSQYCDVNAKNVHAYILGEHGDSEFAVWSGAMVGGTLIKDYCLMCEKKANNIGGKLNEIFKEVRDSAYKIIESKGETSYGIGLALTRITQAIVNDENTILPVSTLINGFLGIHNIYLSLPCVLNKNGISQILKIELNSEEKTNFKNSADKLRTMIEEFNFD